MATQAATPPQKSFLLTAIFSIVLGVFGVDRFYLGKVGTGIVKLLTCGGAGVWWLIDVILLLAGKTVDKANQPLEGANTKNKLIATAILVVLIIIGAASPKGTQVVSVSDPSATSDQKEVASDLGTRENPLPLGSTIKLDDEWEVTLSDSVLDATSFVSKANQFNPDAPEGLQYAKVKATLKYIGKKTGTPMWDLNFKFVSAAGTTHETTDALVVADGEVSSINEMYPNATAEGIVIIAIPVDSPEQGVWSVSTTFGDPMYFKAAK